RGGGPPGGAGMMGGGPPGGGGGAMGGAGMGMMGGQSGGVAATPSDSFLTVLPSLKRVFDNLDFSKRVLTIAADKQVTDMLAIQYLRWLGVLPPELSGHEVTADDLNSMGIMENLSASGFALRVFSKDRFTLGAAIEYRFKDKAVAH